MKRLILLIAAAIAFAGCTRGDFTSWQNPLTYTDIPDSDVIRVGDDYYMISTTMYFCPGAPVMHSRDLVHWSIVSYVYDCLEDDDVYNLRNGRNAYGKGQWAASLRYEDGVWYALFIANDQRRTYIYHTDDVTRSNWERSVIDRPFHDASLLFEDGRVFVAWGNGDLRLTELEPDLSAVKEGGVDQVIVSSPRDGYILRAEGSHIYHIGEWYYLMVIDWPAGNVRTETCWRSESLTGEWEPRVVLQGAFDGRSDGVAQGAIVDTPEGDWYSIMFQDHGAVGRIPTLQRVTWVDGWPVLGDNGVPEKTFALTMPLEGEDYVWSDDEFDSDRLALVWQWNHKPLDGFWSLNERPGWLRLTTGHVATGIADARNTLTQGTVGPACESIVKMDCSGMKPGDYAGICTFQSIRCLIGIQVGPDGARSIVVTSESPRTEPVTVATVPYESDEVHFAIDYDFNADTVRVKWSADGVRWNAIDFEQTMRFTLDYFTGYRTALFNYATIGAGGHADFDFFHQRVLQD